jgi:HK97 family phage major capsid protein
MDYFAKINELQANKRNLVAQAETLIEKNQFGEELDGIQNKIKEVSGQIEQITDLAAQSVAGAKTVENKTEKENDDKKAGKYFNSLGEQLRAVYNFAKTGRRDERLDKVNNEVKGAETGVGADGGFAIQEDFAGAILESAAQQGEILSRVNMYTVGANSNSVRWVAVDETDIASSVYGGVQMYWAVEGGTVNASKPKFREVKCDLEKMMGFAYVTEEMLEDVAFMSSFLGRCFTLASQRLLEDAIISGDGSGKPQGILGSGATIQVAKTADQAAGTITADNILGMWQRGHYAYRKNMVWLAHPDTEEQLQRLAIDGNLLWMPEGGLSASPYQRVLGRPVVYTDQCSEIGKAGDIILADLSKYTLVKKGSARQDWSMHVEFLTDQQCFRMVLRANGRPEVEAPIMIKNTKLSRSPFVTLAQRA